MHSPPETSNVDRAREPRAGVKEPWAPTLLIVFGLLAFYLPTLAPGPTFTDGPEITVAVDRLGVIHPTGYPIFTVLAHVFTRLFAVPLPVIVKIEIFNALSAVGAALCSARATRELLLGLRAREWGSITESKSPQARRRRARRARRGVLPESERRAARFGGTLAGLALGLSPMLWAQVCIPEVYPFTRCWSRRRCRNGCASRSRGVRSTSCSRRCRWAWVSRTTSRWSTCCPRRRSTCSCASPASSRPGSPTRSCDAQGSPKPRSSNDSSSEAAWGFPLACLAGAIPIASYAYLLWANANTDGMPWGNVDDWSKVWDHMTGKQYQRFIEARELSSYWRRIAKTPGQFDQQFLLHGAVLFFVGLTVLARRARAFGSFALVYLLLNVGHALHYAVGDYANYFLPAVVTSALLIGVGAHRIHVAALARPEPSRHRVALAGLVVVFAATGSTLAYHALHTKRLGRWFAPSVPLGLAVALGLAAIGVLFFALWLRFGRPSRMPRLGPEALPRLLIAVLAAVMLPSGVLRALDLGSRPIVGASYGEEVTSTIPRGGVLLTQGDGYLFTMWYEHHVLGRGIHTATLDMGNLKTPWYQRYLFGRYPDTCDPLAADPADGAAGYEERCGSFRKRIDLGRKKTWTSLGLRRGNARKTPVKTALPIVRGKEARCSDPTFRKANVAACRCWGYGEERGTVEEVCVHSFEEGGIAPRSDVEVLAHRIIEDELERRPLFERNVFTHWLGNTKENPREWKGPAYFRIPGQYDLLNRGRVNQIVRHADLVPHAGACDRALGAVVEVGAQRPVEARRPGGTRELALPNDRATLFAASYLKADPRGDDDDARRRFAPGESVYLALDWFERHTFDPSRPGKRGAPIREGVRACVFDPDRARVGVGETVSGTTLEQPLLNTSSDTPTGSYLVQACSVGEVGDRTPPFDDLPCKRLLLEYGFEVSP
jgi:hypothetical protein